MPAPPGFVEQSAAAQAAYSGLSHALLQQRIERCSAHLPGGFSKKIVSGKVYWYHQMNEPDGSKRQTYVGPDSAKVRALIDAKAGTRASTEHLGRLAKSAAALGCYTVIPKHFRVIRRLADHGIFEAGGLLVGTHAFLAYQNHWGVTWQDAAMTVDLDFAHPGRNLSVAIVPEARMNARSAIESLAQGFVPITSGTSFRHPQEPDFDLDFLTLRVAQNEEYIDCPALNVKLQPGTCQ